MLFSLLYKGIDFELLTLHCNNLFDACAMRTKKVKISNISVPCPTTASNSWTQTAVKIVKEAKQETARNSDDNSNNYSTRILMMMNGERSLKTRDEKDHKWMRACSRMGPCHHHHRSPVLTDFGVSYIILFLHSSIFRAKSFDRLHFFRSKFLLLSSMSSLTYPFSLMGPLTQHLRFFCS